MQTSGGRRSQGDVPLLDPVTGPAPAAAPDTEPAPGAVERSAERYRRARMTTVVSVMARGTGIGSVVVGAAAVSRAVPEGEFGLWILLVTSMSLIGFADLGIGNGLLNVVSEAYGRDDVEMARRAISSAAAILSGLAVVLGVAYLAVGTRVDWAGFLGAGAVDNATVTASVGVLVACALVSLPLGLSQRVSLGYQEGWIANLWILAGYLVSLALLAVAIVAEVDVTWLVAAGLVAQPIAALGTTVHVFGVRHRTLRPRFGAFDGPLARRVVREGAQFFLLGTAFVVSYQADSVIVAQHLGVEASTQLNVPLRLFMLAPTLVSLIAMPLWPAYGEALARGDARWARSALVRSSITGLAISTVSALTLLLLADPIIDAWVDDNASPSGTLLVCVAIWSIIYGASIPLGTFLNGTGALRVQVVGSLLMAVTNITGSYALVRTMGVEGPLVASIVTHTLFALCPALLVSGAFLRRSGSEEGLRAWAARWTTGPFTPAAAATGDVAAR